MDEKEAFRRGLEIGIRAACAVWDRALNEERHVWLARTRAGQQIAELLDSTAAPAAPRTPPAPAAAPTATPCGTAPGAA
jgi:hypothetical protein